jgi:secreted Zn-dependent insulinase-like peptidase
MSAFEISFVLTEVGVKQYETVISALFKYLEMLLNEINNFKMFSDFEFFRELKLMSEIGFKYYKIPDPMDNVCDLANEMFFSKDLRRILKDVYPDVCVDEVDMPLVTLLLS